MGIDLLVFASRWSSRRDWFADAANGFGEERMYKYAQANSGFGVLS